jgi:hypothetical protein
MLFSRHAKYFAGAALAVLGLVGSASADTVQAKFTGIDQTVFTVTVKNSSGTYNVTGGGGTFHWDGSTAVAGAGAASNAAGFQGLFDSFCIDIKDDVALGNVYQFNLASLSSAPILGTGINADLTGGMGSDKMNVLEHLFGQHLGNVNSTTAAGAFQLAVWEVVYDALPSNLDAVPSNVSQYDVTSFNPGDATKGFMVGSSSIASQANNFLHDLNLASGPKLNLAALSSSTYQDQVVVVAAPLPAAAWGGMALFGLVSGMKLRRMRRSSITL